ncbi:hypothetical protein BO86DRAFT_92562 [Aspergillus japonicus CBS 114.51]|uniref:Uncharacterized protein n=1 Tax=Aspergillus japonicus CBS 114.51 TaxID=1448312 RepID=A0A8T8X1K4_ASPJA|nr:hypothetical protein BO86DRAFT_92562 [Aspergillus japonicus CBS 114.51]RAH81780.1 hypothetical protein BO86DRAFT_92562 [Aspergillus japonicus CBS 114.51]
MSQKRVCHLARRTSKCCLPWSRALDARFSFILILTAWTEPLINTDGADQYLDLLDPPLEWIRNIACHYKHKADLRKQAYLKVAICFIARQRRLIY